MKNKNKQLISILLLTLVSVMIIVGISAYRGITELVVTKYRIVSDVSEPLRIVQLTDLHSVVYGGDNSELATLVAEQEPDLIFLTGDMLSGSDNGPEVVCALIPQLTSIAPVYYGYGNHEIQWENRTGKLLEPMLTEAGATVVNCSYVDVTLKGQALRIGGYYGYWRQPHMFRVTPEQKEAEFAFFEAYEDTDRLKLLLCHIPTTWLDWGYIDKFPVDVVFSGHYHGGQIRIPGIGGLYAPYVGWFPEYTRGLYEGKYASCVLSAGVDTENWLPRINNLPEIVVLDMIPQT